MDAKMIESMDADALRLAIAEAKGWSVYHYDKDFATNCYYSLIDDSGDSILDYPDCQKETEGEAWNDAPDWPNDLAAAWELVDEIIESDERMSVSVQVKKGNIQFCDLTQWNPFHKPGIVGRGETKEIAICRAWLMWKAGRS